MSCNSLKFKGLQNGNSLEVKSFPSQGLKYKTQQHFRYKKTPQNYRLFLLFLFVGFFPLGAKGQVSPPTPTLSDFTCFFYNLEGQNVYQCASEVKAIINLPPSNTATIQNIVLTFPNTFKITNVSLGVTPLAAAITSPTQVTPGGNSYSANDLLTQEFNVSAVNGPIEITFSYRNCNVYYGGSQINTTALFFDCEGWTGAVGTGTHYLAFIQQPTIGNPGLPASGNAFANAISAITPIGIDNFSPLSYNQNYTTIAGTPGFRYFKILINSQSIQNFKIEITDELDVTEGHLEFCFPDLNIPNPFLPTMNLINTVGNSILGSGIYQFSLPDATAPATNQVPASVFVGGSITIRQAVTKSCAKDELAKVFASINCDAQCPDISSNTINLNWHEPGLVGITASSCTLENISPGLTATSACNGTYQFTLGFSYSNPNPISYPLNVLNPSILDQISIPINTASFNVTEVQIADGTNNFTTIPHSLAPTGGGNQNIIIDVAGNYNGSSNWPGFSWTFNNPFYDHGAWINTMANTELQVRIILSSLNNTDPCNIVTSRLTPPGNNPVKFNLRKCNDTSPINVNVAPFTVVAPTAPTAQVTSFYASPPSADVPIINPIHFICQINVPTQSPFQIDAASPGISPVVNTQINCNNTIYRVILSTTNPANIGSIVGLQIPLNGTIYTVPTVLINNTIYFDLPNDPSSTLLQHNYNFQFDVNGFGCPNTNAGGGDLVYNIQLMAICADCGINPATTFKNLDCDEAMLVVHCTGLCERAIDTHNDMTIYRTTFGWENQSQYQNGSTPINNFNDFNSIYSNAPYNLTPQGIQTQLRNLYPFDNFTIHLTGNIKPLTTPFLHTGIAFELNYPDYPAAAGLQDDFFQFINCTLVFTPALGGTPTGVAPITVNFQPAISSPTLWGTPPNPIPPGFNMRDLFWDQTNLYPAININGQEYNIELFANFMISSISPLGIFDPELHCLFKTYTTDATDPEQRSCDLRSDIVHVFIPRVELDQNSVQTGNISLPNGANHFVGVANSSSLCEYSHAVGIKHIGGFGDFMDYRPLSSWPDKITDPNLNLLAVDDFYAPGIESYSTSDPFENVITNKPLLMSLEAGEIPLNFYQGLILSMKKSCPNSNGTYDFPQGIISPLASSAFKINPYAYVHWTPSGGVTVPTITVPPINIPTILPSLSNAICSASGFPNAGGTVTIPNGTYDYDFTLSLPGSVQNLPVALEITVNGTGALPPNLLSNLNYFGTNNPVPNSGSNLYYFNSGVGSSGVHMTLPINLSTPLSDPDGCYSLPFTITFTWHVLCGTAVIAPIDDCLNCNTQVTFQRGVADLSIDDTNNHFEMDGCNLKWVLELHNPTNQPTITLNSLNLEFGTGMIYESAFWHTNTIAPTVFTPPPSFSYLPPSGALTFGGVNSELSITSITLNPGETLTYELIFKLSCDNSLTPNSLISYAALISGNICGETYGLNIPNIPINFITPDPSTFIAAVSNPPCCFVPNITVTHACGLMAPATGGTITVDNPLPVPNFFEVTLYFPPSYATSLTLNTTASSLTFNEANTGVNMEAGTYQIKIWNQANGSYFEQNVVILDYSFLYANLNAGPSPVCSGTTLNFNTSYLTLDPDVYSPVNYQINLNGSPILGASGQIIDGFPLNNIYQTVVNSYAAYSITMDNGTCSITSSDFNVEVYPTAIIADDNINICSGTVLNYDPAAILTNIVPLGTTYTWLAPTVTGGITGGTAGSNQTNVNQPILLNLTNTPQTATYVVEYITLDGCSATFTLEIIVNPKPSGFASTIGSICSGGQTLIALNSNVAGTTYGWTASLLNGSLTTGFSGCASGCGSNITQTLINTSNTPAIVRYIVTPTANGCFGNPFYVDVTVNPSSTGFASAITNVCSGNSTSINLNSQVAGTSYTWTASLLSGSLTTGFSNCTSGCNNNINQILINTSNLPAVVQYVITPTANSCAGPSFIVNITVNTLPNAPTITGQNFFCTGSTTALTSSSATSYLWSPGGSNSQTNNVGLEGNYTVTITNGNGCSATSLPIYITQVVPVSVITADSPTTFCEGGSVTLTGLPNLWYQWFQDGISIPAPAGDAQSYTVTESGVYELLITVPGTNCNVISSDIQISVLSPSLIADAGKDVLIEKCEPVQIGPLCPNPNCTYSWSPSNGLSAYDIPNPIAFTGATTIYTLTVTAPNGSITTDQVKVTYIDDHCVENADHVYYYNVYTSDIGTSFPAGTIGIMGTLYVNSNFNINGNEVIFRGNAQIRISYNPTGAPITLTIQNGAYLHGCCLMWEGIEVNGGLSGTVMPTLIIENSTIEDAKKAVWIRNDSPLFVSKSTFNKNQIGINIGYGHAGPLVAPEIIDNKFLCDNNVMPGITFDLDNLRPPLFGKRSYMGVLIENSTLVTVGPANTFDNLDYGIISKNSDIKVISNNFLNIDGNTINNTGYIVFPLGTAIGAFRETNLPGGLQSTTCFFHCENNIIKNGNTGIQMWNKIPTWTNNNIINNMKGFGIVFTDNRKELIQIYNNKIYDVGWVGIYGKNNRQSKIEIESNEIFNNSGIGASTGICLDENMHNQTTNWKSISHNTVDNLQFGIRGNYLYRPIIQDNDINLFHTLWGDYAHGIQNINGFECQTYNNNISGSNRFEYFVDAIREDMPFGADIRCNYTVQTGSGIFMGWAPPTSTYTIQNNVFNKDYWGIVITGNTKLGNQYTAPNQGYNNKWYGQYSYNLNNPNHVFSHTYSYGADGSQSVFYTNWNYPYRPVINDFHVPSSSIEMSVNAGVIGTTIHNCVNLIDTSNLYIPIIGGSSLEAQNLANLYQSNNYFTYPIETKWWKESKIYGRLQENDNLMIGQPDLQLLKDSVDTAAYGPLYAIRKILTDTLTDDSLLFEQSFLSSLNLTNSAISTNNTIEENIKRVNEILISIQRDTFPSSNQLIWLRHLAEKCPILDGPGVYNARSILRFYDNLRINYMNDCEKAVPNNESERRSNVSNDVLEDELFLEEDYFTEVFPNPAINFITINSNEHIKQITIFDISGNMVIVINLNAKEKVNSIDIKQLAAGLYTYNLLKENGEQIKGKVSIVK